MRTTSCHHLGERHDGDGESFKGFPLALAHHLMMMPLPLWGACGFCC